MAAEFGMQNSEWELQLSYLMQFAIISTSKFNFNVKHLKLELANDRRNWLEMIYLRLEEVAKKRGNEEWKTSSSGLGIINARSRR